MQDVLVKIVHQKLFVCSWTSHAGTMKLLIPRKAAANGEKKSLSPDQKGTGSWVSCQIVAVWETGNTDKRLPATVIMLV